MVPVHEHYSYTRHRILKKFNLLKSYWHHYIKYRGNEFKLSVLIPVYNGEKTLEKAIDSILSQKTTFNYKIIIADDGSTDNTRDLIEKCYQNNPNKIKTVFREQNIGMPANLYRLAMENVNTEYFAVLDADDFYTSNDKLQIQVDALDSHLTCTVSSHPATFKKKDGNEQIFPNKETGLYKKYFYTHTSSKIIRSTVLNYLKNKNEGLIEDSLLGYMTFYLGEMYFINQSMSVYSYNEKGIWASQSSKDQDTMNRVIRTIIYYYTKGMFIQHENTDKELLRNSERVKNINYYKL